MATRARRRMSGVRLRGDSRTARALPARIGSVRVAAGAASVRRSARATRAIGLRRSVGRRFIARARDPAAFRPCRRALRRNLPNRAIVLLGFRARLLRVASRTHGPELGPGPLGLDFGFGFRLGLARLRFARRLRHKTLSLLSDAPAHAGPRADAPLNFQGRLRTLSEAKVISHAGSGFAPVGLSSQTRTRSLAPQPAPTRPTAPTLQATPAPKT